MVKRERGALLQMIVLDREGPLGLSSQISAALRTLVLEGALRPGERLPATRTLARDLGVARSTVVDTFEQLGAEGLLETRTGSGTYVTSALAAQRRPFPPRKPADAPASVRLGATMAKAAPHFARRIDHRPLPFTTAMPAFDAFPLARWASLSARHWRGRRPDILGYPDPHGHRPLREAVAAHLRTNRGIACEAGQVFVTGGAQQAFQITAQMLLDPGDPVWFEEPGAIGARNAMLLSGARIVPVPVDGNGLDVAAALRLAAQFRLAFVTPAHQQPTGAKMSIDRRLELLAAADAADAWIIEDDWDGEFCFSGSPLPTLKGIDRSDRVIYVGTFSKSLFPALRLGFVVAPAALTPAFESALRAFAPSAPLGLQATLAAFIEEGDFAAHVRRMRRLYAERHQALLDAAGSHLGEWLTVEPTNTGLHTVARFKCDVSAQAVTAAAHERGVVVTPVSHFALGPVRSDGLVLGFAGYSPAQIDTAAAELAKSFRGLGPKG